MARYTILLLLLLLLLLLVIVLAICSTAMLWSISQAISAKISIHLSANKTPKIVPRQIYRMALTPLMPMMVMSYLCGGVVLWKGRRRERHVVFLPVLASLVL